MNNKEEIQTLLENLNYLLLTTDLRTLRESMADTKTVNELRKLKRAISTIESYFGKVW